MILDELYKDGNLHYTLLLLILRPKIFRKLKLQIFTLHFATINT